MRSRRLACATGSGGGEIGAVRGEERLLPHAMKFLRDLKKNNNREWFTSRKTIFEENVRQPMIGLVSALHREMLRFAPEYVGDPAKCVYRIYRDTRFSPDKTPYKTYTSALMWRTTSIKRSRA